MRLRGRSGRFEEDDADAGVGSHGIGGTCIKCEVADQILVERDGADIARLNAVTATARAI